MNDTRKEEPEMLKLATWWRRLDWTERGSAIAAAAGFFFLLVAIVPELARRILAP
jgi:hypothetical protein